MKGAKSPDGLNSISKYHKRAVFYNNGERTIRIFPETKVPRGFKLGKLPEPKYILFTQSILKPMMKSHWAQWANKNLDPKKIPNFIKQLTKENLYG